LENAPTKISPLEIAPLSGYLNPQTQTLSEGNECIKGGFGLDENGEISPEANLFPIDGHVLTSLPVVSGADHIISEHLVSFNADLKLRSELAKSIDPFENHLVDDGMMESVLQEGDSGSGLLCRRPGENYKLVAIYRMDLVTQDTGNPELMLLNSVYTEVLPEWLHF